MKDRSWLRLAEYSLLAGSGVGTLASIAAQNVVYASAPLTALVALGLVNRNRLERNLARGQETLARQNRIISRKCINLGKQVTAMPSPEALTNFQRSVMDRNDRSFFRFSREVGSLREEMNRRLNSLHMPDLSQINQDICLLQDQYTHASAALEGLASYIQRLSTLPRVEAAEAQISTLKTELMKVRVNLETLSSETKSTVSYLQDTFRHLDRRLRQTPASLDASLIKKEEVQELIKAITHLVPRREFDMLANRLQEVSQKQTALQQTLNSPDGEVAPIPARDIPNSAVPNFEAEFFTASFQADIARLAAQVEQLEQEMHTNGTNPLLLPLPAETATDLLRMQGKVTELEALSQQLNSQQKKIRQQIEQITQTSVQPLVESLDEISNRLSWTEEKLQSLNPHSSSLVTSETEAQTQWIVDFPSQEGADNSRVNASRRALESAIDWAQQRLVLVWPWSNDLELDSELVHRFQQLLARQCQLEIGWCHRGNRQEGRLVRAITLRWGTESAHLKTLKAALNQLMPLRQNYPDRFRFKVLGTDESFLVCDRTLAILSLHPLQAQSSVFPTVDLRLQTTNPEVVHTLAERFDNPQIAPGDAIAYFNRGTTRYDLRDQPGAISDFTEVLDLEPTNSIAYNNRGVALVDLGQIEEAKEDFTQAIALNPGLFSAYCNRGWLSLEQNHYQDAVADFSKAVEIDPESPMPYLYRGSAIQKLGDLVSAIENYDLAVKWGDSLALPYFFRSAAYDKQGDRQQAIADLEKAQLHLEAQGDRQILSTVQRTLQKLKNPGAAHSTQHI